MLSLLKLVLSEYAEKLRFWVIYLKIAPKYSGFLLRTYFGNTRHLYGKNEPTLARQFWGGGGEVHGKVCWLIA